MASSILMMGGAAMLPSFIPRLHAELLRAIEPPGPPQKNSCNGKAPPPVVRSEMMVTDSKFE